jgi:hypothetical protein
MLVGWHYEGNFYFVTKKRFRLEVVIVPECDIDSVELNIEDLEEVDIVQA